MKREEEAQKRAELTRRKLEGQEIVPGLFVGGRLAASNPDWILHAVSEAKLSAVLNCTPNVRNFFDSSSSDTGAAETEDTGERELEELDNMINTTSKDEMDVTTDEPIAIEAGKEENKIDAKMLVDLLTQEPEMRPPPAPTDLNTSVHEEINGDGLLTQQPMSGEDVFFATLETMDDAAKLAILESIALPGDELDAEAIRLKEEEDEADRKSAELVKETEKLIQRSKQRVASSQQAAAALNIKLTYERIAIDDNGGIELSTWFEKAASFIGEVRSRGEAVLVHCREGRSRSVTMCIAYMMIGMKMPLKDAMARVHAAIFDENVNDGFKRQLMDLDLQLFGTNSIDFHDRRLRNAGNTVSYSDNISEITGNVRKSKRTRNRRKQNSDANGEEDEDFTLETALPPAKIKATRSKASSAKVGSTIDVDESEREDPTFSSSTDSHLNVSSQESADLPELKLFIKVSSDSIADAKAKNENAMEEDEVIDIESTTAAAPVILPNNHLNGEDKQLSSHTSNSKMQVDNDGDIKPETSKGSSTKPKPKPTQPAAPTTPKKSSSSVSSSSAAAPSPAKGKKKPATLPSQKNNLLNYFGKKPEAAVQN